MWLLFFIVCAKFVTDHKLLLRALYPLSFPTCVANDLNTNESDTYQLSRLMCLNIYRYRILITNVSHTCLFTEHNMFDRWAHMFDKTASSFKQVIESVCSHDQYAL